MSRSNGQGTFSVFDGGAAISLGGANDAVWKSKNNWFVARENYVYKIPMPDENPIVYERRKKRFENEVKALLALDAHEEIVSVISYCLETDNSTNHPFYKMPRYKRVDDFPSWQMIDLFQQFLSLAKALSAIHQEGFFHRDIKPENILYSDKTNGFLFSDFGLVTGADVDSVTGPAEHVGPRYFAPPEFDDPAQIKYMKKDPVWSASADFYMFAKTIWALLQSRTQGRTGSSCFGGEFNRRRSEHRISETIIAELVHRHNCNTDPNFEPFYDLMEGATRDNYKKRLRDSEAISLLEEQIRYLRSWSEGYSIASPAHQISAALDGADDCITQGGFSRDPQTIAATIGRLKSAFNSMRIVPSQGLIEIDRIESRVSKKDNCCFVTISNQPSFSLKSARVVRYMGIIKTLLIFQDHIEIEPVVREFVLEPETNRLVVPTELWI